VFTAAATKQIAMGVAVRVGTDCVNEIREHLRHHNGNIESAASNMISEYLSLSKEVPRLRNQLEKEQSERREECSAWETEKDGLIKQRDEWKGTSKKYKYALASAGVLSFGLLLAVVRLIATCGVHVIK